MPIKHYYIILDLPENADIDQLNDQFRKKIKQFHPDRFADNPEKQKIATETSKKINQAYTELKKHIAIKNKIHAAKKTEISGFSIIFFLKQTAESFLRYISKNPDINTRPPANSPEKHKEIIKKKTTQISFSEILAKKAAGTPTAINGHNTARAKAFEELVQKRSRYYSSSRKKHESETGAVSPVSRVKAIKPER